MRRREFITLLGGAAAGAWPLVARAQQPERVRRIGVLMVDAESDPEGQSYAKAIREGLKQLGWIEGSNVKLDYRWAAGDARLIRTFAKELVELKPEVILARSTPATAALKDETRTIPIVFTVVSDPIGSGFVTNLAHPGGNITGFTNFESSISGKWLGLLKEIAPRITQVGAMYNPETAPYAPYYVRTFEVAAKSFSVEPISVVVHNDADIERAIAGLARESNGGLIILPDAFTTSSHRTQIIEQAARHHVPAVYPYGFIAVEGGLMSYGIDVPDLYQRAASYIDRIFHGTKPSDLPVQQPTKFELVINLKTAKSLGITVPATLLTRADEVIE
jgi:putative ABC transport system substrate-binding protein